MQPIELRKDDESGELLSQLILEEDTSEVLGRDEKCGVVLKEETVSAFHAEIYYERGTVLIRDLSSNGTIVNGVSIKKSIARLKSGSLVKLGRLSIKIVFLDNTELADRLSIDLPIRGGVIRRSRRRYVRSTETAIDVAESPIVQIQEGERVRRKTVPYFVPVADLSGAMVDAVVERAPPGDEETITPPEKIREGKMSTSVIRGRIREAIERLPLDGVALRSFYDAYQFRRSVRTTNEGGTLEESRSLAYALERALTCELTTHQSATASPVPDGFKDALVRALELVQEPPLRIFRRTVEDLDPETSSYDESVADALLEYARHAQNGLAPEPW